MRAAKKNKHIPLSSQLVYNVDLDKMNSAMGPQMRFMKFLVLLPFKILAFLLSCATGPDINEGDSTYKKSKISYEPVGADNKLIQVSKNK